LTYFDLPYHQDLDAPLGAALRECEVHCVANCCGINAFEVTVDNLQRWAKGVPAAELERARCQVDEVLAILKGGPETFFFLDDQHARQEVTEWFESIRDAFVALKPVG
jgi:Family of unknown function (DUF6331)